MHQFSLTLVSGYHSTVFLALKLINVSDFRQYFSGNLEIKSRETKYLLKPKKKRQRQRKRKMRAAQFICVADSLWGNWVRKWNLCSKLLCPQVDLLSWPSEEPLLPPMRVKEKAGPLCECHGLFTGRETEGSPTFGFGKVAWNVQIRAAYFVHCCIRPSQHHSVMQIDYFGSFCKDFSLFKYWYFSPQNRIQLQF